MSLNHDLAALFHSMADLMDIKGENTFKVLAFRKVGRILEDLTSDIAAAAAAGTLDQIDGIGKSSARIIEEFVTTGRSSDADQLIASVPAGLPPLLQVEGLGPKTISLLWKERNITSADELSAAIAAGKLAGIKGIGEKKIEAIRKGLENRAKSAGRVEIAIAHAVAQMLIEQVRKFPGVIRAEVAGSLRRYRETIGDIDLLAAVKNPADSARIAEAFSKLPGVDRALTVGAVKASIVTESGLQVDLRIVPADHFGAALLYFTGSKDHNVKIRSLAQKQGLTLNEWGLYRVDEYDGAEKKVAEIPSAKPVAAKTEEEIYAKLGLPYVVPELREDRGEVEAALAGKLPELVELKDIRGELHTHTTASDGIASIEQMAEAAIAMGYEYLAITDHSKSSVIANGLSAERLLKHAAEIRRVNDRIKGIRLLAGSEVDIMADGHLDYEDAVLAELDFVVASPHVALKQDPQKATDRLRRAIEHRYVNCIGHPTGRLIGGREGLSPDFAAIFKAAADTGTALEINAGHPRLDLNDVNSRAAAAAGAMLAINTDAHSPQELANMAGGVRVARRGWLNAGSILNCLNYAKLWKFLKKKR